MEINALDKISPDELFIAFDEAFKGYDSSWNREQFDKMLVRCGFVAKLSYGAFDDGKLVSFTFNCTGKFNGIPTAYDTGTGTIAAWRGKGLATKIFDKSLPGLKKAGVAQYILEVLQHNTKAVSVYAKIGFSTTREFNYFVQNTNEIKLNSKPLLPKYELRETDFSEKETMMQMWDSKPSWQNAFEALSGNTTNFKVIGGYHKGQLIGYGIIEPASGDIPQLAVAKPHRRNGIGSAILKTLLDSNQYPTAKVINTETTNIAVTEFLKSHNFPIKGMQFGMAKKI
ncbi:MAG TPA: GNAT family N-acetyltransferase [Flavobacterium sp.]|nr:GNAT family N-acetyltransferase [Flavobacterium sp.]